MNALLALWLPILLSAVTVFFLSSLVHMVIKWHANDYRGFTNEDAVRAAINAGKPTPGQYCLPYCGDMKEMASEAMKQKYREGPIGFLMLAPSGDFNMGKTLAQWFAMTLLVSFVAAALAVQFVPAGDLFAKDAAKFVGALTFLSYGFGSISDSIWMCRPWSVTLKFLGDSALYGLGSGLIFLWLW